MNKKRANQIYFYATVISGFGFLALVRSVSNTAWVIDPEIVQENNIQYSILGICIFLGLVSQCNDFYLCSMYYIKK